MARQLPLGIHLPDNVSFDTFVAGKNLQAAQHVRAFARGSRLESPVYLWGARSTGKTHLLQSACVQGDESGLSAVYVPLRRAKDLDPAILDGLEQLHMVCLDDIQAIAGDIEWERSLFGLFNRIRERDGRLLIAATGTARALRLCLPDLASRLTWGVTYRLLELDDNDKVQVLLRAAHRRGLPLVAEAARYLLERYPRDLGSLIELLGHLDQASLEAQRKPTIPFLRAQMKNR
jgi:DnaA family protein